MASLIGVFSNRDSLTIGVVISHVMVLREEHNPKQLFPKLVTEEGISMDTREEQPLKQ